MAEYSEYVWVKLVAPKKPCRILNFGSVGDKATEFFVKHGYEVTGVDLMDDPHAGMLKNYEFRKGDIFKMEFDEQFECIYAISSIEHVGLPCYEGEETNPKGDVDAVKKLYSLLSPTGTLLITIPYGHTWPHDKCWRIYDKQTLNELVGGFKHSVTFLEAIGEFLLNEFRRNKYKLDIKSFFKDSRFILEEGEEEENVLTWMFTGIYNEIWRRIPVKALTQEQAEKVFAVACIKIWK